MEKLEFKTKDLGAYNIEDKICSFYNLGYANSSSFIVVEEGISNRYTITATKGTIEFLCTVWETKENDYLVMISPIKIKRK